MRSGQVLSCSWTIARVFNFELRRSPWKANASFCGFIVVHHIFALVQKSSGALEELDLFPFHQRNI